MFKDNNIGYAFVIYALDILIMIFDWLILDGMKFVLYYKCITIKLIIIFFLFDKRKCKPPVFKNKKH